jgi:hypothetical protein
MSSVAVHMALYKNEFTINHELASSLFMSFIVVHELLAVSSRRLAVSPCSCGSVQDEFTINHELASSLSSCS